MIVTFRPKTIMQAKYPLATVARILLLDPKTAEVIWTGNCSPEHELRIDLSKHASATDTLRLRVDVMHDGQWIRRVAQAKVRTLLRASRLRVFVDAESQDEVNTDLVAGVALLDWLDFDGSLRSFTAAYSRILRAARAAQLSTGQAGNISHFVDAYEFSVGFSSTSNYSNLLYMLRFYSELNLVYNEHIPRNTGSVLPAPANLKYREAADRVFQSHLQMAQRYPTFPAALLAGGFACVALQLTEGAIHYLSAAWAQSPSINRSIGLMKNGPATYAISNSQPVSPQQPELDLSTRSDRPITILWSADVRYLRKYVVRIVFQMAAAQHLAYHFHLVDDEELVKEFLGEFEEALTLACRIRGGTNAAPSWSWSREKVPTGVPDERTYFACARYMHVEFFLDSLGSDLWIQDADSYLSAAPDKSLERFTSYDVTVTTGAEFDYFVPWFAVLGFSTFVSNSPGGRRWAGIMRQTLARRLAIGDSWMLDQTALFHCSTPKMAADNNICILAVRENESIVTHLHSSMASVVEN
ncbi:hypothetical protein ACX80T_14175 [Arthrobacter sp. Sr33]